ncbi:IclR family transcriptional regulator [Kineosporia succinea]|uniref:DNA-binding IclR family transcriptional regulator n=1 Tax=Kineosporia succinea TaxID=84632 RepID=A0ABT9P005_9ACTN|nr:IclR family transcriptional regulator [Kineosporia succinea]MDP9826009.1 DNA-binding IclR family transcriptional regulator [Kineosporia succinea]
MAETTRAGGDASQVQSVDRALMVLDLLARRGELGVTELATELAVHKSTAFRLVTALERRDLVQQVGDRGKYRLGLGVLRLAAATTGRLEVSREGREVCERLAHELGETVNIAIMDDDSAVNVLQEYGNASVMTRNWIGRRTPLHATSSGKVLLAFADGSVRKHFLSMPLEPLTENTLSDPDELLTELVEVTGRGWASTYEELEIGLTAVAAPVRDGSGQVIAAVSASGPSFRLTRDRFEPVAARLVDGAAEISSRLGYFGA